jgi:hypothetical protein
MSEGRNRTVRLLTTCHVYGYKENGRRGQETTTRCRMWVLRAVQPTVKKDAPTVDGGLSRGGGMDCGLIGVCLV